MRIEGQVRAEAFVLAGGRSIRMGRDKALLEVAGCPLVEHMLCKLRAMGYSPRIAGSRADLASFAPVVEDLHQGCGPLSGIEAALAISEEPLNLFVPVDAPFLPIGLLKWLVERASITGALATVPSVGGQAQPLCAVYRRELLPAVTAGIESGDYKVMRVIRDAAERKMGGGGFDLVCMEAANTAWGGALFSGDAAAHFLNCNTPNELQRVRRGLQPNRNTLDGESLAAVAEIMQEPTLDR